MPRKASLLNSASTDGFKQHILKFEDQENGLTVEISDNKVKFNSASGESNTGCSEISYDKLLECTTYFAENSTY